MKTLVLLTLTLVLFFGTPMAFAEQTTAPPEPAAPAIVPEQDLDPTKLADPQYLRTNGILLELSSPVGPDFPVLTFLHVHTGELVVVMLDARNGRETWSLTQDPIVLILLPASNRVFVDSGFKSGGPASKKFEEVAPGERLYNPSPDKIKYDL